MNKIIKIALPGIALLFANSMSMASVKAPPKEMSSETKECVKCHTKNNPGIVQQWGRSKHYGANVGCYECHQADEGDVDAYVHDDKKVKKTISTSSHPKRAQKLTILNPEANISGSETGSDKLACSGIRIGNVQSGLIVYQ